MTTEFPSADDATRRDGSALSEGLGPLVERIGSPPDTHCWDDDSAADCWSYSPQRVAELLDAAVAAERERQDFQADTACEDRCRSLEAELDRLRAENERLRKIAAHVPAATYIAAKERAGFGVAVTPNTSISASGAEARE